MSVVTVLSCIVSIVEEFGRKDGFSWFIAFGVEAK